MPTYLTPGVYVEEVPSAEKPIEGVEHVDRRVRGLGAGRPGQHADADLELDPVREDLRRPERARQRPVHGGRVPRALRLRVLPERRQPVLGRPRRRRRRQRRRAARAPRCRPRPTRPSRPSRRRRSRASTARSRSRSPRSRSARAKARTRPTRSRVDAGRRQGGVHGPDAQEGPQQPRDQGQRAVEADQDRGDRRVAARGAARPGDRHVHAVGRRRSTRRRSSRRTSRATSPAARAWAAWPPVDEVTMVVMPDIMTLRRRRRRRPDPRSPGQDDRPLRERRRPHGDPRRAAGPAPAGDPRVADEHRRLRLQVRGALLPVDRGHGPADEPADAGSAVGPRGRRVVPHGLHRAASTRRPPTRSSSAPTGSASRSRRPSRAASTRSASTASARSRAAASACGARARCRAIPSGATSTSGGSSTTSPSRSWRARSGRCSSPTTSGCGCSCGSRRRTSCCARGARGRCSAPRPSRRSSSSATRRPTRPR